MNLEEKMLKHAMRANEFAERRHQWICRAAYALGGTLLFVALYYLIGG